MKKHLGKELKEVLNLLKRNLEKSSTNLDISPGQGRILNYIKCQNDSDVYQKDIEEEFNIRSSSATQLLQKLEKKGMIVRVENKLDKRSKLIKITQAGSEASDEIFSYICRLEEDLIGGFSDEEIENFYATLEKMKVNLEKKLEEVDNV